MRLCHVRLLLAIDDDSDRQWLKAALRSEADLEVSEVRDLDSARRAARKTEFGCVIASDRMLVGHESQLACLTFGSPLIIWSSLPDSARAEQALAGGAEDFLVARETDAVRLIRSVRFAVCRHEADRRHFKVASPDRVVIEQLAATVAHGINNPASYITHNLAFLRDTSEAAAQMVDELQRLSDGESATGIDVCRTLERYQADRIRAEMPRLLDDAEHGVTRIIDLVKELQSLGDARIGPADDRDLAAINAKVFESPGRGTSNEPSNDEPSFDSGPLRVLVIDDERFILSSYERMLRPHVVTTALSAEEAFEIIHEDSSFDGVLCDLMMPRIDGREFYRVLHRVAPHLRARVAFCTAGAFTDSMKAFVSTLTAPVLDKPVRPQDILTLTKRWRSQRRRPSVLPQSHSAQVDLIPT